MLLLVCAAVAVADDAAAGREMLVVWMLPGWPCPACSRAAWNSFRSSSDQHHMISLIHLLYI